MSEDKEILSPKTYADAACGDAIKQHHDLGGTSLEPEMKGGGRSTLQNETTSLSYDDDEFNMTDMRREGWED